MIEIILPLQRRHNERDGVSNHQPHECLLDRLFRRRSKKTLKLRHWHLWGEFIGHRWIPRTNDQWRGKCFHLMTSWCGRITDANPSPNFYRKLHWRSKIKGASSANIEPQEISLFVECSETPLDNNTSTWIKTALTIPAARLTCLNMVTNE